MKVEITYLSKLFHVHRQLSIPPPVESNEVDEGHSSRYSDCEEL